MMGFSTSSSSSRISTPPVPSSFASEAPAEGGVKERLRSRSEAADEPSRASWTWDAVNHACEWTIQSDDDLVALVGNDPHRHELLAALLHAATWKVVFHCDVSCGTSPQPSPGDSGDIASGQRFALWARSLTHILRQKDGSPLRRRLESFSLTFTAGGSLPQEYASSLGAMLAAVGRPSTLALRGIPSGVLKRDTDRVYAGVAMCLTDALTSLQLVDCRDAAQQPALWQSLAACTSLLHVTMSNCGMDDASTEALSAAAVRALGDYGLLALQSLNLSHATLKSSSWSRLLPSSVPSPVENRWEDDGVAPSTGRGVRLRSLTFNSCHLDDIGAFSLGGFLAHAAPSLESLHLRHNRLGAEGLLHVASGLRSATGLKELVLHRNLRLGDAGVRHVAASCRRYWPSLQVLNVAVCGMTNRSLGALAVALTATPELRSLHLGGNDLGVLSMHGGRPWSAVAEEMLRSSSSAGEGGAGGMSPFHDRHHHDDGSVSYAFMEVQRRDRLSGRQRHRGGSEEGAPGGSLRERCDDNDDAVRMHPFELLQQTLATLPYLHTLDISDSRLDDSELTMALSGIAGRCAAVAALRALDASGNARLHGEGWIPLLVQPGFRALEVLRLSGCQGLGDEGVALMGEAMQDGAFKQLRVLEMELCSVGPDGVDALLTEGFRNEWCDAEGRYKETRPPPAQADAAPFRQLKRLHLASNRCPFTNRKMTESQACALLWAIKQRTVETCEAVVLTDAVAFEQQAAADDVRRMLSAPPCVL